MNALRNLFDDSKPGGRRFEKLVQLLIVYSLLTFALETMPELAAYERWFHWSEVVVVVAFTVEYVGRLAFAPGRWRYALSPMGIIDLLAIAPFYLRVGFDLRSLRLLRLIRILRIAKLRRYSTALQELAAALRSIRHELSVYLGLTFMLTYLAAVGIYYCENATQPEVFKSVPASLWWAVVTLTTVGYGDAVPVTIAGRLFTFVILVLALGVVSVPSGLLASALVKSRKS